jgi:hypothetical protein
MRLALRFNALFHLLLGVFRCAPRLVCKLHGVVEVVSDEDIVEDGAGLDLPQLEANVLQIVEAVDLEVGRVIRVVDLWRMPCTLVVGVFDAAGLPRTLVLRIVNKGRFPLAILLLVPVLGLGGVGICNLGGNVVVPLWFDILRVVNVLAVIPVFRFLGVGVVDCGRREQIPVLFEFTGGTLLEVNEDGVRVVGMDDEVYTWLSWSVSHGTFFLVCRFSPLYSKIMCTFLVDMPQMSGPNMME